MIALKKISIKNYKIYSGVFNTENSSFLLEAAGRVLYNFKF